MPNFQPFDENVAPAHHPVSRGFSLLAHSSGFVSLDWGRYGYSSLNEGIFITEVLQVGEGIVIRDFVSMGTLPWSAITFTTAPGERHFFAINHDNSDSLYRFMLLDITG